MKKNLLFIVTLLFVVANTQASVSFSDSQKMLLNCMSPSGEECHSLINSNFNGTPVTAGNYIWFNSIVKVSGITSYPVTVYFFNQSISSSVFSLSPPDALLTIYSSGSATVSFSEGQLMTTAQNDLPGNFFLSGLMYKAPSGGIPGGLNPVSWEGDFYSSEEGVSVQWKWAAAVYTDFNEDYNELGIKPIDANQGSVYLNSDHAGTPEYYKSLVTGGARGGGGSNFTGSYSGTASANTCLNIPQKKPVITRDRAESLVVEVEPNPFSIMTNINVTSSVKTWELVEIYDMQGIKIQTLFDGWVEPDIQKTLKFSAEIYNSCQMFICVIRTDKSTVIRKIIKTE